ncbi:MAG: hypothetical protein ACJAVZ_003161 [Afipia broomeae]|jgi:hypothetical protein
MHRREEAKTRLLANNDTRGFRTDFDDVGVRHVLSRAPSLGFLTRYNPEGLKRFQPLEAFNTPPLSDSYRSGMHIPGQQQRACIQPEMTGKQTVSDSRVCSAPNL